MSEADMTTNIKQPNLQLKETINTKSLMLVNHASIFLIALSWSKCSFFIEKNFFLKFYLTEKVFFLIG